MNILAINGGTPVRTKLFPAYKYIAQEEKDAALRVLDSGILSRYLGCWDDDFYGGPEVQAFEKEWAVFFGVKHAIAVNSCTSGLIAALGSIDLEPGDEVIVPPYTMSATATAPLWYGAIPVFADIEPNYFCIDPASVEKKISKYTKAIIAVDIFGQPHNATAIADIAKRHNVKVITDCAQAPGAMYKGKYAGTVTDLGVYSLNYHKHIHTGEGGVVVTNDDTLAEKVQLIRNHAESVVGDKGVTDLVNMVGQNYRLTEMQAAIGREQLKKLLMLTDQRITNCNYLAKGLSEIPGILAGSVREESRHVFYIQPFLYDEKKIGVSRNAFIDAVKAELPASQLREGEGPLLGTGYVKPLYLLPLFQKRMAFGKKGWPFTMAENRNISYDKGECPVAERLHEKELFSTEMMRPPATQADLDDVIAAFQKVYDHKDEIPKE